MVILIYLKKFKKNSKKNQNCKHGDVTIYLFGCSKCDHIDINNLNDLGEYETNGYVIIETGTLSFSSNIQNTLKEIKRISGGDFYSAGGTQSLIWKYYGYKKYSKQYPTKIKYIVINRNIIKCIIY